MLEEIDSIYKIGFLKQNLGFTYLALTLFSVLYNLIHSGFGTLTFNKFMEKLTI